MEGLDQIKKLIFLKLVGVCLEDSSRPRLGKMPFEGKVYPREKTIRREVVKLI